MTSISNFEKVKDVNKCQIYEYLLENEDVSGIINERAKIHIVVGLYENRNPLVSDSCMFIYEPW